MLVAVENLPPEGRSFSLRFSREDVDRFLRDGSAEDVRGAAELVGEAKAVRSGRDVFLAGSLRTRLAYQCVRCLEAFEEDVRAEFHRVLAEEEEAEAGEIELRREELEVEPIHGGSIDLWQVVAEELLLALKPYPVCRESCQGLCPACGGNRNLGECHCSGAAKDSRFAVLATLAGKPDSEG